MKKIVVMLVIAVGFVAQGWGQSTDLSELVYDSNRNSNPKFDEKNARYKHYHLTLSAHDPILYLGFMGPTGFAPHFSPVKERVVALDDREGTSGYRLEGDLNHRFVLYKGAYYSPKILRRVRWTFDAGFIVRMTRDKSSPLLPTNNKFGLGFDYLLSSWKVTENDFQSWVTIQVHHYSRATGEQLFTLI